MSHRTLVPTNGGRRGVRTRLASVTAAAIAAATLAAACGSGEPAGEESALSMSDIGPALESITTDDLRGDVEVLAADSFMGRAPGTVGGETIDPAFPDDWVAGSLHVTDGGVRVEDSELVFVGYGVRAPEYDWDDYAGMDMTGKTLVMLVNDPPVPDPEDPSRLDGETFNGEAMTYYGRWTYKYEIASELGAAAAIIVHETEPAGYPWAVVTGSWGVEQFALRRPGGNADRVAVEGWITRGMAERIVAAAGHDFDELKAAAARSDFEPVALDGFASFTVRNTVRELESRNVVAMLEGADPERRDEYVVYTAHWDHLGVDPSLEDDTIYNGALDNATGTAALLELAEAFAAAPSPPDRSILFLAVTAEEKGLLGARYYAENPLHPLERTLANINIDGMNQWGRTEDIVVVGYGNSTLDDLLEREAATQGRTVEPDPEPEKGYFYRSDHFEFAKQGVPALYTDVGTRYIDRPEGYGERKREEYVANDYHKPSDEIKPDWDLSGAVADVRLLFRVGYRVATTDAWPEWSPGTEFRATREAMLAGDGTQ
ncbi:MAG: M28 family peptidase [Gemmatimonadota bacterium]